MNFIRNKPTEEEIMLIVTPEDKGYQSAMLHANALIDDTIIIREVRKK